jgi:hypothetical protein
MMNEFIHTVSEQLDIKKGAKNLWTVGSNAFYTAVSE